MTGAVRRVDPANVVNCKKKKKMLVCALCDGTWGRKEKLDLIDASSPITSRETRHVFISVDL